MFSVRKKSTAEIKPFFIDIAIFVEINKGQENISFLGGCKGREVAHPCIVVARAGMF